MPSTRPVVGAEKNGFPPPPPPAQRWLARDTSYQRLASQLCASDPRLGNRDPKATIQKIAWDDSGVRALAMRLGADNKFSSEAELTDPAEMAARLVGHASEPGRRTVWIVEGLGPAVVAVFGDHFGLHPSVFVEQERVVVMSKKPDGESDGLPLPSALRARGHVCFKYFEVMCIDRRPASFRLVCADTGRHIGVSRDDGVFNEAIVVRRKATFWSRKNDNDGWDCLILCDPPVRRVRTGEEYKDEYAVKTKPYQGGYVDFVPHPPHGRPSPQGPPRIGMLDDLAFYLREHVGPLVLAAPGGGGGLAADPDAVVGGFVRKVVASHYLRQAEHLRAVLSQNQRALSRKIDLASLPMDKVEDLWSDTQAWERRTAEYCEDLEAIMMQLGIPLEPPDLSSPPPPPPPAGPGGGGGCQRRRDQELSRWLDPTLDFQFLHLRFSELRRRVECLNGAVTGLASITGNRQAHREQQLALATARRSMREANRTKAVTLVGLVFIPLAYVSSLFSMTDPYAPGGQDFKLYWVVSLPLIVLVLGTYYVLDLGYTDDDGDEGRGSTWSLRVFLAAMRVKLRWAHPRREGGAMPVWEGTTMGK
ncbi:hypothetical protein RB594_002263 [Gaeumannomyces avenae]